MDPMDGQGAAPGGPPPGGGAPPSAGQPNPEQLLMAQITKLLTGLAQSNPTLSSGIQKAIEGLQEAQTAMFMNRPGNPQPGQTPPQ
jgi:hypothetical protein